MTDLLKKLHAELAALFQQENEKEEVVPGKKKSKVAEVEEDDEVDDVTEDAEEEEAPKKKKSKATLVQVKAKLKELLDEKGRKAAVKVLEAYDAEKVGDIDEDQFQDFINTCQLVLDKGPTKKKEEDEDDLNE